MRFYRKFEIIVCCSPPPRWRVGAPSYVNRGSAPAGYSTPLLLTFRGHRWRPVEICWLEKLPPLAPLPHTHTHTTHYQYWHVLVATETCRLWAVLLYRTLMLSWFTNTLRTFSKSLNPGWYSLFICLVLLFTTKSAGWQSQSLLISFETLFVVTARKRSCGMVMFLQLSVILFTRGLPSHNAMGKAEDTPSERQINPPPSRRNKEGILCSVFLILETFLCRFTCDDGQLCKNIKISLTFFWFYWMSF